MRSQSHAGIEGYHIRIFLGLIGMIITYDCPMLPTFVVCAEHLLQARIVNNLWFPHFDHGIDCQKVLKHVSKSYDIFRVVCSCHEDVVCVYDLHEHNTIHVAEYVSKSHTAIVSKNCTI